jgi:hypothetical protein
VLCLNSLVVFSNTEAVVARIDETVKEYGRQFDTLMVMLKEQVTVDFDVLYAIYVNIVSDNLESLPCRASVSYIRACVDALRVC